MNIRRLQRESDREQLARRTLMEIFYKFLHVQSDAEHPSSSSAPVLPPLSEFKKLGSIALLMKSKDCPDHLSVEKAMNDADSALRTTISQEIFQWVVTMKAKLGALLNADSSRQGNSTNRTVTSRHQDAYVTLVNRPSAFFLCGLCASHHPESAPYASGEGVWRALTFKDVAQHACRGAWANGGVVWSVEQFAPDWVAIGAMKEVLSKAGIDEDATDVKERMAAIGRRVRCETCEGKIIVPLPDVVCFSISQCVKD